MRLSSRLFLNFVSNNLTKPQCVFSVALTHTQTQRHASHFVPVCDILDRTNGMQTSEWREKKCPFCPFLASTFISFSLLLLPLLLLALLLMLLAAAGWWHFYFVSSFCCRFLCFSRYFLNSCLSLSLLCFCSIFGRHRHCLVFVYCTPYTHTRLCRMCIVRFF